MLLVVSAHKILKNGTALKNLEFISILILVGYSRNTTVWIDLEKPWFFLFKFRKIKRANLHARHTLVSVSSRLDMHWNSYLVLKPQLFKSNRDFEAVGSALGVKSNIGLDAHFRRSYRQQKLVADDRVNMEY